MRPIVRQLWSIWKSTEMAHHHTNLLIRATSDGQVTMIVHVWASRKMFGITLSQHMTLPLGSYVAVADARRQEIHQQ